VAGRCRHSSSVGSECVGIGVQVQAGVQVVSAGAGSMCAVVWCAVEREMPWVGHRRTGV